MKRALSLFLAAIMVFTVIPATLPVTAEEGTAEAATYAAAPEAPAVTAETVVYLEGANGSFAIPEGATKAATLTEAILAVADGGRIIVVGDYTLTGATDAIFVEPEHAGTIEITAKVDETVTGKLVVPAVAEPATTEPNQYVCSGDTIFSNIEFATTAIILSGNFNNTKLDAVTFVTGSDVVGGINYSAKGIDGVVSQKTEGASLFIDNCTGLTNIVAFSRGQTNNRSLEQFQQPMYVYVNGVKGAKGIYGAYECDGTSGNICRFGDVVYDIIGCEFSDKIVGGTYCKDSSDNTVYSNVLMNVTDTKITTKGDSLMSLMGGNYKGYSRFADVTVNIGVTGGDNTKTDIDYVNGLAVDGNSIAVNVTLNINGGTISKFAFGCGYQCEPNVTNVEVNINGGVFGSSTQSKENCVGCGTIQTGATDAGYVENATLNINEGAKVPSAFGMNMYGKTKCNIVTVNVNNATVTNELGTFCSTLWRTDGCNVANLNISGSNTTLNKVASTYYLPGTPEQYQLDCQYNVIVNDANKITKMYLGGTNATAKNNDALLKRINLLWKKGTISSLVLARNYSDMFVYYDGSFSISGTKVTYTPNGTTSPALSTTLSVNDKITVDKLLGSTWGITGALTADCQATDDASVVLHKAGEQRIYFKQLAKDGAVYVDNTNPVNSKNAGTTKAAPVYDLLDAMWLLKETGGDIYLMSDIAVGKTNNWHGSTGEMHETSSSVHVKAGGYAFAEPIHNGKYTIKSYVDENGKTPEMFTYTLPAGGYIDNATEGNETVFDTVYDHVVVKNEGIKLYENGEKKGIRLDSVIDIKDIDKSTYEIVEFGTLALPAEVTGAELEYFAGALGYGKTAPEGDDANYYESSNSVVKFVHYAKNMDVTNYKYNPNEGDTAAEYYTALYGTSEGFKAATINFRGYALVEVAEGDIAVVYGDTVSACYNTLAAKPAA